MAGKSYDKKVWFLLKEIWCAVPKISFTELCEIVAEITKMDVPAPNSVGKKCKIEKWEKSIRSYCRKADSSLKKIKSRLLKEILEEYESLQEDSEAFHEVTNMHLPIKSGLSNDTFEALKQVGYKNRKTIDVIQEHRNRTGKIGQLLNDSMDWMYEAKTAVFDSMKTEEEQEKAKKQFGLLEQFVEKIESFSRTQKNLWACDMVLFGINVDDTRDSPSSDRQSKLNDDSKFDAARERLKQQYIEMQKQAQWIESGRFEQEVMNEVDEQTKAQEAEDAEYRDIYGDDDDDDDDDDD